MVKHLLLILCVLPGSSLFGQNLFANGNFEDRNTCTELHAVCAPEGWFRIPLDAVSNKRGTAGFFLGNHNESFVMENVSRPVIFRSYIYTKLLCPLEKGREYVFTGSFRTGSNDEVFRQVNLLFLSFEPFHYRSEWFRYPSPLLTITKSQATKELSYGWHEYQLTFTATGEEQYLVIGNLGKGVFSGKPTRGPFIIYDIDDVSLLPVEKGVNACAERNLNRELLYSHNYRHTPGKFLDEEDKPVSIPAKDTPLAVVPAPAPQPVSTPVINDTLVIPDVLFRFDKAELNPQFAYRLDTLVSKIQNKIFQRIEVLGHTDSFGTDAYNQKLSASRAETVKKYLMSRLGYAANTIITKAFAATLPVSTNATPAGRQKNRRVEIVLVK